MNTNDCMMYLVGNQVDNEQLREVSQESAGDYAKENLFAYAGETSAKTGQNVEEVFIRAAKMLYLKNKNEWGEISKPKGPGGQKIERPPREGQTPKKESGDGCKC